MTMVFGSLPSCFARLTSSSLPALARVAAAAFEEHSLFRFEEFDAQTLAGDRHLDLVLHLLELRELASWPAPASP